MPILSIQLIDEILLTEDNDKILSRVYLRIVICIQLRYVLIVPLIFSGQDMSRHPSGRRSGFPSQNCR